MGDPTRDVNFLYSPTKESADIALACYYNNNPTARNNVVERERGDGVIYTESTPLAVVNTYEKNLPPQLQNGVATAQDARRDRSGNQRVMTGMLQSN